MNGTEANPHDHLGHEVPKAPPVQLSYGERAVGLSFNPSADPEVNRIKVNCAILIDQLHERRVNSSDTGDHEVTRMLSLAITAVQEAQMWAVKAVTWRKP